MFVSINICKFSSGGEGEKEGKRQGYKKGGLWGKRGCRVRGKTCRFTDEQTSGIRVG